VQPSPAKELTGYIKITGEPRRQTSKRCSSAAIRFEGAGNPWRFGAVPPKRENAVNRILLLGAGFSRNWGGRLASEVRSDLQTALHGNRRLSVLLQQRDFKSVLGVLQGEFARQPNSENQQLLSAMQETVSMFVVHP
jgi:hypothetical protein